MMGILLMASRAGCLVALALVRAQEPHPQNRGLADEKKLELAKQIDGNRAYRQRGDRWYEGLYAEKFSGEVRPDAFVLSLYTAGNDFKIEGHLSKLTISWPRPARLAGSRVRIFGQNKFTGLYYRMDAEAAVEDSFIGASGIRVGC